MKMQTPPKEIIAQASASLSRKPIAAEASMEMPFVISSAPIMSARVSLGSAETADEAAIGSLSETKKTIAAQSLSIVAAASLKAPGSAAIKLGAGWGTGVERISA